MTITNALSAWLADTPPLAEGQSLSLARNAMIDIAGCMVAGAGDPAIRAWLPRITMTESPEDDRLDTAPNGREPALVTVHARDGRRLETFVMFAKGVLQNPMTTDEMWAKYDDCVGDVIDAGRAGELRSALEGFESLDRVADLMEIMRWQP